MTDKPRISNAPIIRYVQSSGYRNQLLFQKFTEYRTYVERLKYVSATAKLQVFACCLLPTSIHIIYREESPVTPMSIRRINSMYATYVNRCTDKSGPLFNGRSQSKALTKEQDLQSYVDAIHHLPVKLGLVQQEDDYFWSSASLFTNSSKYNPFRSIIMKRATG
ncbi:hypothetical protein [Salsuginibacillus kocurii]|uniref:hypothetical protein n=1 Tax=Salsuginibacillus kocurii TaxID=427078 RepID=UPI0003756AC0|nr:hypothetical protein [Salsuginibacillus kocurii]